MPRKKRRIEPLTPPPVVGSDNEQDGHTPDPGADGEFTSPAGIVAVKTEGRGVDPSEIFGAFPLRGQSQSVAPKMMEFTDKPLEMYSRTILKPEDLARKERIQARRTAMLFGIPNPTVVSWVDLAGRISLQDGRGRDDTLKALQAEAKRERKGLFGFGDRLGRGNEPVAPGMG